MNFDISSLLIVQEQDLNVQIVVLHLQHCGDVTTKESPCVMHVSFIHYYNLNYYN